MEWFLKALRQYADFEGRARRKEYWLFTLFTALIVAGVMAVLLGLAVLTSSKVFFYLGVAVVSVISLGLMVPSWAVTARRLHDTGKSGWLQLISLVPYVGVIVVWVLCALEGTPGPNQYGPDPKALPDTGAGFGGNAVPGLPY